MIHLIRQTRFIATRAFHAAMKGRLLLPKGANPIALTIKVQALLAESTYESVASDKRRFVAELSGADIKLTASLYDKAISSQLGEQRDRCVKPRPLLYVLVRLLKPDTVVETGVASGHSSAAILQALEDNGNKGKLFSIDLPSTGEQLADGRSYTLSPKGVGWAVPENLRYPWHLLLGDAKDIVSFPGQLAH